MLQISSLCIVHCYFYSTLHSFLHHIYRILASRFIRQKSSLLLSLFLNGTLDPRMQVIVDLRISADSLVLIQVMMSEYESPFFSANVALETSGIPRPYLHLSRRQGA